MSQTEQPKPRPTVTIVPGDDDRGLCPTLIVDGVQMHDPIQPYSDVLMLEGKEPQVVAAFGVGLGYGAAGVLLMAPNATVVAFEPIEEMAEIARRMLAEEWNLAERVFIETDLADFQARLLDAVAGMQSLATIELAALSEYRPEWAAAFRSVIEEIVDADTLGSMRAISSEGWANIGRATDRIANTPLLSSLAGVLDGRPAVVVTDLNPAAETIDALRRAHAHATLVATPAAAVALHAHGLNCDLVIADEPAPPPVGIVGVLASTTLAITPESHPSWWELPAAARMVFGHSAVSWMFADGDPTAVFSLSFGPTLPLSLACLSLGARPIAVVSPPPGLDSRWNLMSARTRTERVLSRCAALAGSEFVSVESIANQPVLAQPTGAIADLARTRGRSLGHAELQRGLARARRAIGRLAREQRQFARTPLRDLLAMYLRFRAEGSAFTKSFLVASSKPLTSPESQASLREAAFGWIDWVEEQLPPAPMSTSGTITQEIHDRGDEAIRVFIADTKRSDVATRVLLWSIDRFTNRRVEVRHLKHEIPARLGARAAGLPSALQMLLVPALCNNHGRAIFIDPSTVLLEDLAMLWELPLDRHAALVPGDGQGGIALLDAARAPWRAVDLVNRFEKREDLSRALLVPGESPGVGLLPAEWSERDRLSLDSAVTRFTCEPWMPWKRELHPLTWLWEFQLLHALEDGYLSKPMLAAAVAHGDVRNTLLTLAGALPDTAPPQVADSRRATDAATLAR
ncbi:MAG: hypothetical protein U0V87_11865 [Acidobacteriota bacterium]